MPIISMVRVGRVQERPFGVLTVVLAYLLLELHRVGRDRNEASRRINDSYTNTGMSVADTEAHTQALRTS